jgi:hypothetical protein
VQVQAWAPANTRTRSPSSPLKSWTLFSSRAYAGPTYARDYEGQDQYYYPPSPTTHRDEDYYPQDLRSGYDEYNQYNNQYNQHDYNDRSYNQNSQPPLPSADNYYNDYDRHGPDQIYDRSNLQDPYYYNQQPQQQQQQPQQPYDDYGYTNYNAYQEEEPPAQVYQETTTSVTTRRWNDDPRHRLSRAARPMMTSALARMVQRPLLQGLLPSTIMDTMMMDVLQPASTIFKTMILQDDLLDLDAVYDDAQRYLEQDPTCAELLGLPLRLDHPFSQSSATSTINGKTQSRTELQFPVDGQYNSGMVQLVATDDGILTMVLLVAEEHGQGYNRINVKLDNNNNNNKLLARRDISDTTMSNVMEAEILQHDDDDDNAIDSRMLAAVEERSARGIPLLPEFPPRGPPSVQERRPSMMDNEATL